MTYMRHLHVLHTCHITHETWHVCMCDMCHITYMHVSCHIYACVMSHMSESCYGVATMSRLLKDIGLFCKRALWKRLYSARETYDFKEPTNRSHPIWRSTHTHLTHTHPVVPHRTLCFHASIQKYKDRYVEYKRKYMSQFKHTFSSVCGCNAMWQGAAPYASTWVYIDTKESKNVEFEY